jgi:hypothetical protein
MVCVDDPYPSDTGGYLRVPETTETEDWHCETLVAPCESPRVV